MSAAGATDATAGGAGAGGTAAAPGVAGPTSSPSPASIAARIVAIASTSSSPSAVIRTRWPIRTPSGWTRSICFALTGPAPVARFWIVTSDRVRPQVRTNCPSGRRWSPFGLRISISSVCTASSRLGQRSGRRGDAGDELDDPARVRRERRRQLRIHGRGVDEGGEGIVDRRGNPEARRPPAQRRR